jgi:hypothetical protein
MSTPRAHTVHIRLVGKAEDVTFWLRLLEDLADLEDVSEPDHAPHDRIRVYAIVTRTAPLKGFPRDG